MTNALDQVVSYLAESIFLLANRLESRLTRNALVCDNNAIGLALGSK